MLKLHSYYVSIKSIDLFDKILVYICYAYYKSKLQTNYIKRKKRCVTLQVAIQKHS